jgi:ABC-2 type transport system ATP-binding protein
MDKNAVECRELSRQFRSRLAVSGLELTVPRGTVFGFLGPNGAGKTTTVRMMIGMLRPSSGSVRVLGHDPVSDGDLVRGSCGVMLDNLGLYDRLSALQNLEFASRVMHLAKGEGQKRIEDALHRVGLFDRRGDRVSGFSKGMRQKLGLARALIGDPEMLILDEPTAGLDPTNIVMMWDLLVSLAKERGRTIFLCTHLLAEAQKICDRVAIIVNGHLVATGDPNRLGNAGLPSFRLKLSGLDPVKAGKLALPGNADMNLIDKNEWRVTVADEADIEEIVNALIGASIGVRAVIPEEISLEEEYLRIVGGETND